MTTWNATILGPANSVHENRIYCLRLVCGDSYPLVPPEIWFQTRINLPCVDAHTGRVMPDQFSPLLHWRDEYTMKACSPSCAASWRSPRTKSCRSLKRARRMPSGP